jgi:DMSO/TMAO reductase YedYZ molybdopterin-dependent catalytic subunit
MIKERLITGSAIGLVLGIPWLAISYAGQQLAQLPLVAVDLFEWTTRVLPGGVVTAGLDIMIQTLHRLNVGSTARLGKAVEFGLAYILTLFGLTIIGAVYALTLQRVSLPWYVRGSIGGFFLWLFAAIFAAWGGWEGAGAISGATWLLALSLLWGLILGWGVDRYFNALVQPEDVSRRRTFRQLILGSLALSGLAAIIPNLLKSPEEEKVLTLETQTPSPTNPMPTPLPTEAGFTPVEGTRAEITPIDDFYRVDINLLPPGQQEFQQEADSLAQKLRAQGELEVPNESYLLVVEGLVENPLALDLNTIKSLSMAEVYATLECISNPVSGDLISTTLFQGARLKDVLDRAKLKPEAVDIKFTCIDGYTESLPLEAAQDPDTLLCYNMGNQPLTEEHGSPLRLYTPNRFGMKNPKWIVKIEAVNKDYFGYWEQRGWSEQAFVKTTSVIDTVKTNPSGNVAVGGIAYAGARRIEKVELQVDEAEWTTAELDRSVSDLTWVLWRGDLDIPQGKHQITVRATEGSGDIQTAKRSNTYPDGATGYHSMSVSIR